MFFLFKRLELKERGGGGVKWEGGEGGGYLPIFCTFYSNARAIKGHYVQGGFFWPAIISSAVLQLFRHEQLNMQQCCSYRSWSCSPGYDSIYWSLVAIVWNVICFISHASVEFVVKKMWTIRARNFLGWNYSVCCLKEYHESSWKTLKFKTQLTKLTKKLFTKSKTRWAAQIRLSRSGYWIYRFVLTRPSHLHQPLTVRPCWMMTQIVLAAISSLLHFQLLGYWTHVPSIRVRNLVISQCRLTSKG